MKHCLTIAGSDCSGGAGIQADLKTFSALGCYGMSVITSVVAENTAQVISSMTVSAQVIADQLEAVFGDIRVDAVKIGMLPDEASMKAVAQALKKFAPKIVVCDPVMLATAGAELMRSSALGVFVSEIIPRCAMLTPNIPEAETLIGDRISGVEDMKSAAEKIYSFGTESVLIKGGHLTGAALDILYDGERFYEFSHARINSSATHGTGCTLSSAIAAYMAQGKSPDEAAALAKQYLTGAIEHGLNIGKGHGPTNHFYRFFE
ncbi:MAG: bifunctional hydroxymethylpyrimidine kinase/phosphomethylpyrimidine kinase [Oscillospiraceae bacterium]